MPQGSYGTGFGFTGEYTDANDNIYLRARYMNPNLGTFLSLDPFEGIQNRPMSLNGYSWVEGNVVSLTDATGRTPIPSTIADLINSGSCATELYNYFINNNKYYQIDVLSSNGISSGYVQK